MRTSYIVRAQKFIAKVFPYLTNLDSCYQMLLDIDCFNDENKRHVHFEHGISRWALITSDYVIKMDYGANQTFGCCQDEYKTYQEAKKQGMAYLFAEITPYEYNGYVFYIMPRIYGVDSAHSHGYDVTEWLTYDEIDYLDDMGLYDLHRGNYGWKNGYPVIIDYAAREN